MGANENATLLPLCMVIIDTEHFEDRRERLWGIVKHGSWYNHTVGLLWFNLAWAQDDDDDDGDDDDDDDGDDDDDDGDYDDHDDDDDDIDYDNTHSYLFSFRYSPIIWQ